MKKKPERKSSKCPKCGKGSKYFDHPKKHAPTCPIAQLAKKNKNRAAISRMRKTGKIV